MVARFLRQELGKNPKKLDDPSVLRCHNLQILTEYFVVEWDALCTLAWMGFTHDQNKVVLSGSMQQDLRCILAEHHPEQKSQLVSYWSQAVNLGLLRSQDPESTDLFGQKRYFIYFTFQEYLTAHYIVDTLEGYRKEPAYDEMITWIKQNKYESSAALVMGFVAGISTQEVYKHAREAFWHALLSPPYDITGLSHLRLMLRCLEEANYSKKCIPQYERLVAEINLWGEALLKPEPCQSDVSKSFWELLRQYTQVWKKTDLIDQLLAAAAHSDAGVRETAIGVLAHRCEELSNQPKALTALLKAAKDQNTYVRRAAISALVTINTKLSNKNQLTVFETVLEATGDKDGLVQDLSSEALRNMRGEPINSHQMLAILLKAVNSPKNSIKQEAIQALERMAPALTKQELIKVLDMLLKATENENYNVRQAAVTAFVNSALKLPSPDQIKAFEKVLKRLYLGQGEKLVLNRMSEELADQPEIIKTLIKATDNFNSYHTRQAAVVALGTIQAPN